MLVPDRDLFSTILNAEPETLRLTMVDGRPLYGAKSLLERMVLRTYPVPGRPDGAFSFDPEPILRFVENHGGNAVSPLLLPAERVPPL